MEHTRVAEVIVVGAGAVGLITALKLGRAGVRTIVLEAHNDILEAPRAIAYMPVVSRELQKLGIYDRLMEIGMINSEGVTWRQFSGEKLATLSSQQHILTLGQDKVARVVLEFLKDQCRTVDVIFGRRFVGLTQQRDQVRILTVCGSVDEQLFESKFLVACDGSNSTLRQMSMIPFEGFTWSNFRFVAADVQYDFVGHCGLSLADFVVDHKKWAVIAKTGKEDIWRVCYGEEPEPSLDDNSLRERAQIRISDYINTFNQDSDTDYKILRLSPYWAHQRCAGNFRQGNLLLAGDAAHSNNPIGGLGLTGGILDAVVIGNALVRHIKGGEPDELVTRAAESRRKIWLDIVNPMSQMNFRRLFSDDPEDDNQRRWFFDRLNEQDGNFGESIASFDNLLPDAFDKIGSEVVF